MGPRLSSVSPLFLSPLRPLPSFSRPLNTLAHRFHGRIPSPPPLSGARSPPRNATATQNAETTSALTAFRKRASEASLANAQLKALAETSQIDFAHYRSVLKNTAVVDELERAVRDFKPVTLDPAKEIKAIEAFEVKAVRHFPPPHPLPLPCSLRRGFRWIGGGHSPPLRSVV